MTSDDQFFDCVPCDSTTRASKCRYEMHGSIDVVVGGDALTLAIDASIIDSIFGDGTARQYGNKTKELKRRILELTDLNVNYVEQTKKVLSVASLDEVAKKKGKINPTE